MDQSDNSTIGDSHSTHQTVREYQTQQPTLRLRQGSTGHSRRGIFEYPQSQALFRPSRVRAIDNDQLISGEGAVGVDFFGPDLYHYPLPQRAYIRRPQAILGEEQNNMYVHVMDVARDRSKEKIVPVSNSYDVLNDPIDLEEKRRQMRAGNPEIPVDLDAKYYPDWYRRQLRGEPEPQENEVPPPIATFPQVQSQVYKKPVFQPSIERHRELMPPPQKPNSVRDRKPRIRANSYSSNTVTISVASSAAYTPQRRGTQVQTSSYPARNRIRR
ncbi:hypothetical protein RUND412_001125 [Rhizina undulata]